MVSGAAPIAIFAYRRADELAATLGSLAACGGLARHAVYLFIDGPKGEADRREVEAVRQVGARLGWDRLEVRVAENNRGLRRSVMAGVSELIEAHGRVIVIEDDLRVAPMALDYLQAGLDRFAGAERVKAVCAYQYRMPADASDRAGFLPFASSWGWATWRRAWAPFVAAEARLAERADSRAFLRQLDRQGIIAASAMLRAQREGLIDSWAILWNAYLAETDGLALFPAQTMVLNGGFGGSGASHASSRNPINGLLARMNEGREFAQSFSLPDAVEASEAMRRRVAASWEARLHRLSVRLGTQRRRLMARAGHG